MFAYKPGEDDRAFCARLEERLRKCHFNAAAAQLAQLSVSAVAPDSTSVLAALAEPAVMERIQPTQDYRDMVDRLAASNIHVRLERVIDPEGRALRYEIKLRL